MLLKDIDRNYISKNRMTSAGFTLIELIMIMLLIGVLTVAAVSKWPSGIDEKAAVLEFKHAVHYAQHIAMTRAFTTSAAAWGIDVTGNQYTVRRADSSEFADGDCVNRSLPNSATILAGSVWFNGLGEPVDTVSGLPLAAPTIFSIGSGSTVTVFQETGYAQ